MNDQLTTEQVIRVYAMYLGRRFRYEKPDQIIEGGVYYLNYACEYGEEYDLTVDHLRTIQRAHDNIMRDRWNFKLLLRPFSAITDEHATEIMKWRGASDYTINNFFDLGKSNLIQELQRRYYSAAEWQRLIKWGYAMPLDFCEHHPLNNQDAIEIGLAIPVIED